MALKLSELRPVPADAGEISDRALLAACATGDRAAHAMLFDRHCDLVFAFLARMLGSASPDVDDLVQVTFLEAFRRADRFRGAAKVETWLVGIAVNMTRRHLRAEQRRGRLRDAVRSLIPIRPAQPEQLVLLEEVGALVRALPFKLRAVVVLCDVEGMKGAEAAALLGIPEGTLWKRLHTGRKALRHQLVDKQEGGQ